MEKKDGSVLLIAGPGSGKTLTLVRRTLSIISEGLATPSEIVLCTFTEKAARELQERLRRDAAKFGVAADMSGLKVGTIHSLCRDLIDTNRQHTALGNNFDVLDEMTQALFINENLAAILPEGAKARTDGQEKYFDSRWSSKWRAIKEMKSHFNKFAEEMVDVEAMKLDENRFNSLIAESFVLYREQLAEKNKIDFAHLQLIALDLLKSEDPGDRIRDEIKYVMVDEYQDTNHVQEELVFAMSKSTGNLCVVGDEDQALYRFRGATVRNILEFPAKRPGTTEIELSMNYRSDPDIVTTYLDFMSGHAWTGPGDAKYRFDKSLMASRSSSDGDAFVRVTGKSAAEVASTTASLVKGLKDSGRLSDYSQVALLLPSVRYDKSGEYIEAFNALGIPTYCPRAKAYFSNDEVKLMVGSIAHILDWTEAVRGEVRGGNIADLVADVDEAIARIETEFPELFAAIDRLRREVLGLGPTESSDKRVADFPYLLLPFSPFGDALKHPVASRNISKLTKLLASFHQYYGYAVVTGKSLVSLRNSLFNSFMRFLYESGEDDVEDPDEMFPPGMVQIMTIHQSKGLEFPFVLVGGLEKTGRHSTKSLDELAASYSKQVPFEPAPKIGEFDAMRLFYVAMSRPQHLLALLDPEDAKRHKRFDGIMSRAVPVGDNHGLVGGEAWDFDKREAPKKSFSFTSDVRTFETCARQYQMYRHLEFEPSRAVTIVFGTLVHQTIEDIHRMQLEGKGAQVGEDYIRERFEFNLKTLMLKEVRYIGRQQQEAALNHVINYWKNNRVEIGHVVEAEVDVTLEEDDFILNGSIDLVRASDGELEILDFKSSSRPEESDYLDSYYQQLCIYAHVYSKRTGVTPSRLVLYWTGEFEKEKARMVFDYNPDDVAEAATHFREIVGRIQAQEFEVVTPPDSKTCNECDFKAYCTSDGTISKTHLSPKHRRS